jgi:hypothetical protein
MMTPPHCDSPEIHMDRLRQFLEQVRAYLGREERGNAIPGLRKRSYPHYIKMEQLEEQNCLTDVQLERWQRIKADYAPEVTEMFSESL